MIQQNPQDPICFLSVPLLSWVGWGSKIISGTSRGVLLLLAIRHLNINEYAILALFWSIGIWFTLCDFGIGNALQNHISHCRATFSNYENTLRNLGALLCGVALFFSIIFLIFAHFIYHLLFHSIPDSEQSLPFYLFSIISIINIWTIVFSVSYRIFLAEHKGHLYFIYNGLGPFISLISILFFLHFTSKTYLLFFILVAWVIPPFLFSFLAYKQCFKHISFLTKEGFKTLKNLFMSGSQFWLVYLISNLIFFIDYIVMAQTLHANDIATYSLLDKGYQLIYEFYDIFLLSIWPFISERYSSQDWHAGHRTLTSKLTLGILFVSTFTLLIMLFKSSLLHFLKNPNLMLPSISIFLFGLINILRIWIGTYNLGLYSQNHTKIILITLPFQFLLGITLLLFLSRYYGLNGLLLGKIIIYLTSSCWIFPYTYHRLGRVSKNLTQGLY